MKLHPLHPDGSVWSVYALSEVARDEKGNPIRDKQGNFVYICALLNHLEAMEGTDDEDAAARILELIERAAKLPEGPKKLRPEICHECHVAKIGGKEVKFFRLRADKLRVVFFYMPGMTIICTHCFRKKGDKMSPADRSEAERVYREYQRYFGQTKK